MHPEPVNSNYNNKVGPVKRRNYRFLGKAAKFLNNNEIGPALSLLVDELATRRSVCSSQDEWNELVHKCRIHTIKELLDEDLFTRTAFRKPRGYAGDAVLLDYVYGYEEGWRVPDDMSPLGQRIFNHTVARLPVMEALRLRRRSIAKRIDEVCAGKHQPRILNVSGGHFREAELSNAIKQRNFGRFCILDSDAECLSVIQEQYGELGVETIPASARMLLTWRGLGEDQHQMRDGFDFIYSSGLLDYTPDNMASSVLERLFRMLRPGGELFIASLLPGRKDSAYLEAFMDWYIISRTRMQILKLLAPLDQSEMESAECSLSKGLRNVSYLSIKKRLW